MQILIGFLARVVAEMLKIYKLESSLKTGVLVAGLCTELPASNVAYNVV